MKPLTNEQKENIFDDIVESVTSLYKPAPGEFTLQMLVDAIQEKNPKISMSKIRHRVYKLRDAEILGERNIIEHGARTKVYFPLDDHSHDEILEVLLES